MKVLVYIILNPCQFYGLFVVASILGEQFCVAVVSQPVGQVDRLVKRML